MKIIAHLIVNRSGGVRATKSRTPLKVDEIAFEVHLTIPDAYFKRPYPVVTMELPPMDDTAPALDLVIERTAMTVAEALHGDVDRVRDGLTEALREEPT